MKKKFFFLFFLMFLCTACASPNNSQPASQQIAPTLPTAATPIPTPTQPAASPTPLIEAMEIYDTSVTGGIALSLTNDWQCVNYDPDQYEHSRAAMWQRMNHPEAVILSFEGDESDHLNCIYQPNYETFFVDKTSIFFHAYSSYYSPTLENMDGSSTVDAYAESGDCEVNASYVANGATLLGKPAEIVTCTLGSKEPPYALQIIKIADENRVLQFLLRAPNVASLPAIESILKNAQITRIEIPIVSDPEEVDSPFLSQAPAETTAPQTDPTNWPAYQSTWAAFNLSLPPAWACVDYDPEDKSASLDTLLQRLNHPMAALALAPYYRPDSTEILAFICYRDPNLQTHFMDMTGTALGISRSGQSGYTPASMNPNLPGIAHCANAQTFAEDGYQIGGYPAVIAICNDEDTGNQDYQAIILVDEFFYYVTFESLEVAGLQPEFDAILRSIAISP